MAACASCRCRFNDAWRKQGFYFSEVYSVLDGWDAGYEASVAGDTEIVEVRREDLLHGCAGSLIRSGASGGWTLRCPGSRTGVFGEVELCLGGFSGEPVPRVGVHDEAPAEGQGCTRSVGRCHPTRQPLEGPG